MNHGGYFFLVPLILVEYFFYNQPHWRKKKNSESVSVLNNIDQ